MHEDVTASVPTKAADKTINNKRAHMPSPFVSLLDSPLAVPSEKIDKELTSYENNEWTTNNLDLLKRHSELLFFKENHMQYMQYIHMHFIGVG